ncbi:MAG: LicD family protein [Candidatus Babeliales bacterium]|nr:LicD family protein [Candidatus Babeliales bacterium]
MISISINTSYCKDPFAHVEPRIVQKLYQTLLDVHSFFTNNNISYFIDSGTLLGAVRHRGLIPWDDDLDLCIFEKDEQAFLNLFSILKDIGYTLIGMPFGYKIYHKDGDLIEGYPWTHPGCDIFIMTCDNKKAFYKHRWSKEQKVNLTVDLDDLFPLRTYNFGPLQVPGPKNPTPYLNNWYGDDYLTMAYTHYNHGAEKFVKKAAKILEGDDFKTIKPLEPLVHNIQPKTTIPQWPVDFLDKYSKAKE